MSSSIFRSTPSEIWGAESNAHKGQRMKLIDAYYVTPARNSPCVCISRPWGDQGRFDDIKFEREGLPHDQIKGGIRHHLGQGEVIEGQISSVVKTENHTRIQRTV